MFVLIVVARNRLVFMVEESQKGRTDRHTQSVTRRHMWHSLKSELGSKVFFNPSYKNEEFVFKKGQDAK
jgi:hypothetical protein